MILFLNDLALRLAPRIQTGIRADVVFPSPSVSTLLLINDELRMLEACWLGRTTALLSLTKLSLL